jgi:epoxyqueuosine reductase
MTIAKTDLMQYAQKIGIDLIGICSPDPFARYIAELNKRKAQYERRYAHRIDQWLRLATPTAVMRDARAVIVIGFYYLTEMPPAIEGRSAFGRIVSFGHLGILKRGRCMVKYLHAHGHKAVIGIHRKEAAVRAGLGSLGKHGLILNKRYGSWVAYQSIVTNAEMEFDQPSEIDFCADCDKCLRACPTNALYAPYRIDPRQCVTSLLTSAEIPRDLWESIPNYIMGCDLCQEACPINKDLLPKREPVECIFPDPIGSRPSLKRLLDIDETNFQSTILADVHRKVTGSNLAGLVMRNSLARRLYRQLVMRLLGGKELVPETYLYATGKLTAYKRNAILAIGNRGEKELATKLQTYANHPVLGIYAQWAMKRMK